MAPNLVLSLLVGVLMAAGVYLLLAPSLVRVVFGVLLLGNGVNILFLVVSGPAGRAPISDQNDPAEMSDPLPQAMVLTAIVISLAMLAFLLALAHRSWQLSGSDLVEVDPEDARIQARAVENDLSGTDYGEGVDVDLTNPENDPLEERLAQDRAAEERAADRAAAEGTQTERAEDDRAADEREVP
jgi:multicomponent Na+:H+ antiporter subunit C